MGLTRAFVALDLPETVQAALARVSARLSEGRIVEPENLHLTLVFLGEIDDLTLEEVHDGLGAVHASGFALRIGGLGVFGGEAPRALWAGVAADAALSHLQAKVAQAARRAGAEVPRRRFVPHVTLARFRPGRDAPPTRVLADHAGIALAPFPVRQFGLYASHLSGHGAAYEELARYPLSSG